jgi:hypothetical protein
MEMQALDSVWVIDESTGSTGGKDMALAAYERLADKPFAKSSSK